MSNVSNTQPLRRLIADVMTQHGWSYQKLADNAEGRRSKSWFAEKARQEWRPSLLDDEDLLALEMGLRKSYGLVRAADLAGWGLSEINEEQQAWIREHDVRGLTEKQRRAVLTLIASMLEPEGEDEPQGVVDDEPPADETDRQLDAAIDTQMRGGGGGGSATHEKPAPKSRGPRLRSRD